MGSVNYFYLFIRKFTKLRLKQIDKKLIKLKTDYKLIKLQID